uniref:Uncharacterized protein n=1 Tax=Arundo donax TaxID=35708 RepID=A0A0A8Z7H2_ARUDO
MKGTGIPRRWGR